MIALTLDMKSIEQSLDDLGTHVNNYVIRGGAQAAAQAFYNEAKINAPVLEASGHWFYGTHQKYYFPSGTLKASIYQVFSKDKSNVIAGIATYQIAWNHKKAPYGFMVEYGTSRSPGHAFMRPAWINAKDRAGKLALAHMAESMTEMQGKS